MLQLVFTATDVVVFVSPDAPHCRESHIALQVHAGISGQRQRLKIQTHSALVLFRAPRSNAQKSPSHRFSAGLEGFELKALGVRASRQVGEGVLPAVIKRIMQPAQKSG